MKISKIGLKKEMEKEIKEMGTEFKDLDTTPTLTLDPFQAADKKETPAVQQVEEPVLDDSILTEEERQTVEAFAKQIDLTNSSPDPSVRSGNAEEDGGFFRGRRWRMCAQKTSEK